MASGFARRLAFVLSLAAALCGAAGAQLLPSTPLPPVGGVIDQVGRAGELATGRLDPALGEVRQSAGELAHARVARLDALVRAHREMLEMTEGGPAVRGEVIAVDPDQASLRAAEAAGFSRAKARRLSRGSTSMR
jgi:hypothetical protein